KRSVYEPNNLQRCRQVVCTKTRAFIIILIIVLISLTFALIAAFARPGGLPSCSELTTPSQNPDSVTTPPIATNGNAFPWTDIRLPSDVTPESYDLLLNVDLQKFTYTGEISIHIQAKKKTDFIVFHSKNISITSYSLFETDHENSELRQIKINEFLETTTNQQIYLKLNENLAPLNFYKIKLLFESHLNQGLTGFYRSSYILPDGTDRWLATTHFEPTDARQAFPCFDEPQLKANFTISLVHKSDLIGLSNMNLLFTELYGDSGLVIDHFAESVRMSTYLVAFVVCDFEKVTEQTKHNNIKINIYTPPSMIDQTGLALEVAVKVLDFYEQDFFQINYPLTKSDHIAIPDFAAGAMENWGLITYLTRSLLYSKEESSARDRQWVATVVAHELAHQWFGNLVTMEWWNDLWLNEGFANFMEYKGVNHARPEWKMLDQFLDDAVILGMSSDGLKSSHPINVPVHDPAEINQIFDAISYQKGGSVIRMLESFLSQSTFEQGLHSYLIKHSYQNAQTSDLWEALTIQAVSEGVTDVNVGTIMDTWTSQMGYPVVNIHRQGNQITATQERFLFNPRSTLEEEFTSPHGYKWYIPLTWITSESSESQQIWMPKDSVSFTIDGSPTWVKMNVNMTGFYRVNYDKNGWEILVKQLNTDHTVFTSADRTSLIEDIFALARSGHVNISMAMDLSRYLIKETEYIPWKIAVDCLGYIGYLLKDSPDYVLYKTYMVHLLSERLNEIKWVGKGDQLDIFLRSLVLGQALQLNVKSTIDEVKRRFKSWREGARIPADLKGLVYHGGIKYGTEDDWQFVWNKWKATTLATEKSKLLSSLAASNDGLILNRFLHMSLDENFIKKSDSATVIGAVGNNPAGSLLAWRFVRQNWGTIMERFYGLMSRMKRIIVATSGHFTTQYDYDEVKAFLEEKTAGYHIRAVPQSLEQIEMNIDWLTRNRQTVVEWLRKETESY
ncbi:hypothetical protein CAPTEDRAFT_133041, partial [Capitella teleta]